MIYREITGTIYKVFNIVYCIEPEDTGLKEEDFALRSGYLAACEKEIDDIVEGLPTEMVIELIEPDGDSDPEDDLSEAVSDKTGWLVERFEYKKVDM